MLLRALLITILLALTSTLLLLSGCSKENKAKLEPTRLVKTITVKAINEPIQREYPARVSAMHKVELSFEVQGKLIKLPIKDGDEVKKGQILAEIDPRHYQYQYDQAKAKHEHALIMFKRYKKLLSKGAVATAEFDLRQTRLEVTRADLAFAKKDLEDTKIKAPFTGVVARRLVENHQYVKVTQPILSLQDVAEIELKINVPERDISQSTAVKKFNVLGSKSSAMGTVVFTSSPNKKHPVFMKEYDIEADQATQTYKITLMMPKPKNEKILPGMTGLVTAKFDSSRREYHVLPTNAVLINSSGSHYIWTINKSNMTAHRTVVKISNMAGGDIKILHGLKKGAEVIVAGGAYIHQGMKVKPITGKIGQ